MFYLTFTKEFEYIFLWCPNKSRRFGCTADGEFIIDLGQYQQILTKQLR